MKRYRRMMPLGSLTDSLVEKNDDPGFREAVLLGLPARVLSPDIASKIASAEIVDNHLVLHIPDEAWRKEIGRHRKRLLEAARKILAHIEGVKTTP